MKTVTALLCALLLALTACAAPPAEQPPSEEAPETVQCIAMDTFMAFTACGPEAGETVQAAADRVAALERLLSRTLENSQVSRLNAGGGPMEVDRALWNLLAAAGRHYQETGGAFDITVAPVASAWGFTEDTFRVPAQEELAALLPLVNGSAVTLGGEGERFTAALGPGQSVDLGAIAKGFAADETAALFAARGILSGKAELGGNILAWGSRPDGTPWRVGIQDPARLGEAGAYTGILHLENAFAVTSGGYQRYFETEGRRYHHIINPADGRPADNGLTSVTVVAEAGTDSPGSGTMCDAYSTALFILGEERALDFWRERRDAFDLVLVTEDGRVLVTAGLAEAFAPDPDSGYAYETVS